MARVESKLLEHQLARILIPHARLDDPDSGIGTEKLSSFIGCDGKRVRVCREDFKVSMARGSKLERRAAARWFCGHDRQPFMHTRG
jgi:hypothetical protein